MSQSRHHAATLSDHHKVALITGITGQDGIYLAGLLLSKGYAVHGIVRRTSQDSTGLLKRYLAQQNLDGTLEIHDGDLADGGGLSKIVASVQPDEIYNLAAQSHVKVSFAQPEYTADVDGLGLLRILEAVRLAGLSSKTRIYQASTSELYGLVQEVPQKESTPFYPRSPYACAKLYAYWIGVNYREAYDMHVSNGILFNHESPFRGEMFVSRKITRAMTRIKLGLQDCLELGNMDAKRDWGHAKDYVEMQWLMLQQDKPDDYVISTGVQYTVRDFVERVAQRLEIPLKWEGQGISEKAYADNGKVIVAVSEQFFRPAEVETLLGDSSKAKRVLGWEPKLSFDDLVNDMVDSDLELARQELLLLNHNQSFVNQAQLTSTPKQTTATQA